MRILFDQGTPAPIRKYLAGHEVSTATEMGWSTLSNGELLSAAEKDFDVFVTTDQALKSQQDLSRYKLAIVLLPVRKLAKTRTACACNRVTNRKDSTRRILRN